MSFDKLQLHPSILKAISASGYTQPTPIQEQAVPQILAGDDIVAAAQTGTGKTAAFVWPALQRLSMSARTRGTGPRVLVLTPTRELANQITDAVGVYGKYLRVRCGAVLGGMPYGKQIKMLTQSPDIVIATPGRLIDHLDRGRVDLMGLEMLVLDEADRMLDMGFVQAVERIAAATPKSRQTLLFSATLDHSITKLAERLLKNPKHIAITAKKTESALIEQRLHYVDDAAHKLKLLEHLLGQETLSKAIVFTATKRGADKLARTLFAQGHPAAALHGDLNQNQRNRVLDKMRRGGVKLLVATDVAARGLDVSGVSHVINFDTPRAAEDYVHRIGRTGRAGATGIAISLALNAEAKQLHGIERYTGQKLPVHTIPGLEPKHKAVVASRPKVAARPKPRWVAKPRAADSKRGRAHA